ncbi:ribulose-phosphate 3-epimerase [Cohnella nanjingensis]|uniref:Ribulose-phosphate 3-epimerase n=1 Tax=Cohnella nanjingensis TaxID=1387779 RepID=A0A7X0RQZ0_9BACL|nr:ribulose-phosphate 3-epimerase [Cohnella nanjingensis]MBB6670800.1 ribulose-phosphate 3-epimerase [Cohnella nanjingensis]
MSIWATLPQNRVISELSLWSADLSRLADEIARTDAYADFYHLDVSDGHFSPQLLFFPDLVAQIRPHTRKLFHVHLMAGNSILLEQIEQFVRAGADILTLWLENGKIVPDALHALHKANVAAGLSIGLDTEPEELVAYFPDIQLITLMGTRIGVKGQDLDENAYTRIRKLRTLIRDHGYQNRIKIAADGGIRSHTVPDLRLAGADTVVMGSLAFGSPDLGRTFAWLHSLPGPDQ